MLIKVQKSEINFAFFLVYPYNYVVKSLFFAQKIVHVLQRSAVKQLIILWCILLGSFLALLLPSQAYAQSSLPDEFFPNYQIADEYERLLDYFIDIEAAARVWTELEASMFRDINNIFRQVFTYFPRSSSNEIVYRQCILISDDLANWFTRAKYNTFRNRCFESLGTIIRDINTRYTVNAKITANPRRWSSPLNVTFDARDSLDPSNDTIPSSNFYWWYRDVFGVNQPIWRWPVVNYTFTEPGNHIVHLTVRSSNNFSEWIFDWQDSIQINVAPKAANMVVFINWQRAETTRMLKIWSQDANNGILIDWTATVPLWARTIVNHKRTIRWLWEFRFEDITTWEWAPRQFLFNFPRNWLYTVELEVIDNEWNRITERYNISVSDPVANIRQKPERWTTWTEFTFDWSSSYSITSRIRTYQRTIIDPNWRQIESINAREIRRRFAIPWTYTINLTTTDEQGNSSIDTKQIDVWSSPPIPALVISPQSERKHPSQFILDATWTFDEDVRAWHDSLTYSWSFSNNNNVNIDEILENDESKITVSMEEPGSYRVKLLVEDRYWERAEIEREITVVSTLRPNIAINPWVWVRWEEIEFLAQVNKTIAFYQRDFGDWKTQQTREPRVTHTYEKSWRYMVTLEVITQDWEENEIKRSVFMWQKDFPVPAYSVRASWNTELRPETTCTDSDWEVHQAYQTERYQNITLDATRSTNAQWNNNNLRISFHPRNDQVYNTSVLSYSFPELWCTSIDLFVEDRGIGKTEQQTIRFEVTNALPTLQNLTLTFPQSTWTNPVWIWSNPVWFEEAQDVFANASIIVRLQARWARDPDGFISHFRWYYYPSHDPMRRKWFRITPGDVPFTTFVIPKPMHATEYAFAVEMIDNDNGRVSSEEIVWKWPIVFFPPEEDSLDIPIVTLTANRLTARVWEEITFSTNSYVLSDNPDFEATRYFKYDFNGDGIYEIPSTRQDSVTYAFTQPWTYRARASVFFRWRAWVGTTDTITILRWLRPHYEVATFGTTALVRDFSDWDIIASRFCMDINACDLQSWSWTVQNKEVFIYEYPGPWRFLSRIDLVDQYANEQRWQRFVDIETTDEEFGILSIPEAKPNPEWWFTISVSQAMRDISIYPVWKWSGNCFIDLDITRDSNWDWDPLRDQDILCNELSTVQLFPNDTQQIWRIYYVAWWSIQEVPLIFDFFDFEPDINPERDRAREKIEALLDDIARISPAPQWMRYYQDLLINLRASLWETFEMNSIIAQLLDYINQNRTLLPTSHEDDLRVFLASLASNEVRAVFGATPYELAKGEVLAWFWEWDQRTLMWYFNDFESAWWNRDAMKNAIDKIYTYAAESAQQWVIDMVDFNYITVQLCDIVREFELPSQSCGTLVEIPEELTAERESRERSGIMRVILRILLRVIILWVLIFWAIVVIFAIKAKKQNAANNEQEANEKNT